MRQQGSRIGRAACVAVLLPVALFASPARAQSPWQPRFEAANQAFQQGDYPTAEAGYRALLDEGLADGNVLYNLGNTCYREGRNGLAMLAWRRAATLLPRDPDLRANLDRARSKVKDRLEAPDDVPPLFFWQRSLSVGEGSTLGSGALAMAFVLLSLKHVLAGRSERAVAAARQMLVPALILGLLGVLFLGGATWVDRVRHDTPPGVILEPQVTARSALGPDGVDLFVLHEGAEVTILEKSSGHAIVGLADGRRGWVPEASVGSALPGQPFPD